MICHIDCGIYKLLKKYIIPYSLADVVVTFSILLIISRY